MVANTNRQESVETPPLALQIDFALLDQRMTLAEKAIADLERHKEGQIALVGKAMGAISVISVFGSAVLGYIYDKFSD